MSAIAIPPQGSKIGLSSAIGTSFAYLSNGTISEPLPAGEQANVVSTSGSDAAAGIGIQKVRVIYFDTSWVLSDEIVTLNGTASVSTVATNILRIESFEAFQVGSSTVAIGTITLKSTNGVRTFAQIDPITTAFTRAIHTVAPGKVGSLIDISVNCTSTGGVTFIVFREVDNTASGGNIVAIPDMIFSVVDSPTSLSLTIPVGCDATNSTVGLRMGIAVQGLVASQSGSASFHYVESNLV